MTARAWVLFVLGLLSSASVAILSVEARLERDRGGYAEAFQRLLGGLGFGPALDLSDCPFGFDPRLDGSCSEDYAPLPGCTCFCPRHAGSVLYYPPTPRRGPIWLLEQSDAPPS